MIQVLSIAWKDIQILLRDRGTILQLFVLPLVFIVVMTGTLGEVGQAEEDARVPLPIVNLDGGDSAQTLLEGIDTAGGVKVAPYDEAEATALLDENEIDRVLIIPAGFTAAIAEDRPVTLRLANHPDASKEENEAVRLVVEGVAGDMSLEIQIYAALEQMGDMQAGLSESERVFAVERMQAQARSQFEQAQAQPLITVAQREPGQEAALEEEKLGLRDGAVPAITVLFVFMGAQTMARSIYDEKKSGSFRRLLAAPLSRVSLLGGKMLPNLISGLIQTVVIFAFGVVGLDLLGLVPATLGNDPLATVLLVVVIALCASALGILIAGLARTEGQVSGLSTFLLWGMGLLIIIPSFLLERILGPVLQVIPHYWASRGLLDLMVRGGNLSNVIPEMAVLLGFALLFFVVGAWKFEFD